MIPLAAGEAQEDETILSSGVLGHANYRFIHLDPPGLISSRKISKFVQELSSGGFYHGALDDDSSGHIFPKSDQKLSRQRDDGRLLEAPSIARHAFLEPTSKR
jgi:hypothetical protein